MFEFSLLVFGSVILITFLFLVLFATCGAFLLITQLSSVVSFDCSTTSEMLNVERSRDFLKREIDSSA